jgi:hypothetical protein
VLNFKTNAGLGLGLGHDRIMTSTHSSYQVLALRRSGYKVNYYLTQERYEIYFLAQTPQSKKKLFQVVWNMQDAKTQEREEKALQAA